MHSLFGASKVAADVLVQEYGRYFGMPTVCFRGGCLTGPEPLRRRAARLPRLPRARRPGRASPYRIYGYKGKQVRDNIHSYDVCTAIVAFAERAASRARSTTSAAAARTASRCSRRSRASRSCSGGTLEYEYVDEAEARRPHLLHQRPPRFRADYPDWEIDVASTRSSRSSPARAAPTASREGRLLVGGGGRRTRRRAAAR